MTLQPNSLMFMLSTMISMVGVLLSVAFFTLMERKMMGLMHYRKGPNKTIMHGLLQPMADATKLLTKENHKMQVTKKMMFYMAPALAMVLMLACWLCMDNFFPAMTKSSKELFLAMSIMSMMAFVFFLAGWGSNSKYALMGTYRAAAQIISYEVCLMLLVLFLCYTQNSFSWSQFFKSQENFSFMLMSLPAFMMWMLICLSESNRTPFDHAESESELVSGFNVEYGGGLFAMIFIAEYGMIMFMSLLTSILFMGQSQLMLKTLMIMLVFIWARCSLPRLRYDKLMFLCWKTCLPYSLMLICTAYMFN